MKTMIAWLLILLSLGTFLAGCAAYSDQQKDDYRDVLYRRQEWQGAWGR